MATPIRAQDREHFEIVQQALAVDGLHVAISSADRDRLADYAGTLARTLASRYGLQVEAYQPGRLEALVADLMLHRYDGALSRISGTAARGRVQDATESTSCVLFIPDAHAVRLQEFTQLARVASGLRQLRLVAMFGGSVPFERDARLQAMGAQLARWDIDADDAHEATARSDALRATPGSPPMPTASAERELAARAAALPRRTRSWVTASAAALAAATATAAVMLSIQPFADGEAAPGSAASSQPAPTLTRSGTVQLAGEPPADFRRAATTGTPAEGGSDAGHTTGTAVEHLDSADSAPSPAAGNGEAR